MNKKPILFFGLSALFIAACATAPYTNRKQFILVSSDQEMKLGEDAYAQVLDQNKKSTNAQWQAMVKRVGQKIAQVSEQPNFEWEFNVLAGKEVNAFALPGGKVAFWEGIIPVCQTEAGIAVVMGHEVAHALARHGAERMSQGMGAQIIGEVLAAGLGNADPGVQQNVMQFYGLGAQVGVLLPFGRQQESESDKIGLILMAKAGYDPREAPEFWKRMSQVGGESPPEFLSTHPSHETRIENLNKWMPEALKHYNP